MTFKLCSLSSNMYEKKCQKFPAEVFETLGVVLFDQTVLYFRKSNSNVSSNLLLQKTKKIHTIKLELNSQCEEKEKVLHNTSEPLFKIAIFRLSVPVCNDSHITV